MHSASITRSERMIISVQKHLQALIQKAIPLSFLFGSDIWSNFFKSYLIAKLGQDELEALIIATNISYLVTYTFPEFVGQDINFIAEYFGRTKQINLEHPTEILQNDSVETQHHLIGSLIRQGWILSTIVSLPASAILISSPYFLLHLFSQADRVNQLAMEYNYPLAISLSVEFMNKFSEGFISAVDKENWLLPYRGATIAVEMGLCFLLIPRYSLAGAGYASLGKSLFGLVYLTFFLGMHSEFHHKFNIFDTKLGDVSNFRKILYQSWPRFITKMANSISIVGVTMFIGQLSPNRIILDSIIGNYYALIFSLSYGINESANRIVAQHFGSTYYRDMRRAGNLSLFLNSIIWCTAITVFNSMPLFLASKLLSKDEVEKFSTLISSYFLLIGFSNFFGVLADNCNRILAALQDTLLASMGSFLSSITITLPFTALVVCQTDFDLYGVAVANILGAMFAALVTLSYWRSHSHAIEASSNENITSSNIRAKDKFQSIFFRERIQYGVLFNNLTYNQIELPVSSDELAKEEHQLLM